MELTRETLQSEITKFKSSFKEDAFSIAEKSITLEKTLEVPLILPSIQHGVRPRIEQVVQKQGLRVNQVIDITSIAILKSALMADMGATILPVSPLLAEINRGELRACPILDIPLSRTVSLCSSKNIPLTHAAMAVEKCVIEVAQDLCASGQWLGAKIIA